MRIIDTYTLLENTLSVDGAHPVFRDWGYTSKEVRDWMASRSPEMRAAADGYRKEAQAIVARVEAYFGGAELPGELVLMPSMAEVDGFARYELGSHSVMLGIDFPGASLEYLRALTAHELSHVYRDHSPGVWAFLGKPLAQITRAEYLEATSGLEHLVSEGLATLASQAVFPEVFAHEHHYYSREELDWCLANHQRIEEAIQDCLRLPEPDPWRFYRQHSVAPGAPSRTHYYWAARRIDEWIRATPGMTLLRAHGLAATEIDAF